MPHRGLRRGPRALPALACAAAGALACACAPAAPPAHSPGSARARPPITASEIIHDGRERGLRLVNPLELEPGILKEAEESVGTWGDPLERLRRLVYFLNDGNQVHFHYAPNLSLTATEAYRTHQGDCMAYANLFISLARGLGLPVYFVHVSEVLSHYERNGQFFTSSHVAVGYGSGPSSLVIDFTRENADWKLSLYRSIDDAAAVALYYNNIAVDLMIAGRLDDAEEMFDYLLGAQPQVEELYNNLGVLLNRRGRYDEALTVLQRGIARFPEYKPLYTNGLAAARGSGRADLAVDLAQRGEAIAETNPYFLFARGISLFERARFSLAAEEFEQAASAKPDSPVIYAWLARAYMSAGEPERGAEAFEEARKLAPQSKLVRDLQAQFPALGGEAAAP